MMKTLKSLIPETFDYHVSKVYEGIYNPYPLTQMNFESVNETYNNLKTEIDKRYSLSSLQGAQDVTRRIDYILTRVDGWIKANELLKNDDAEVFMDAFCAHFEELKDMVDEMDSGKVG